jgi:hypothetical protein
VFFDYSGLASSDFEPVILANIASRAHFLALLTPSSLDRCDDPSDWLRRELETAIATKRNIVPLLLEGFDFAAPRIGIQLTGSLAPLRNYNAMIVQAAYFAEAMERLRLRYLNVPVEAVLRLASLSEQRIVKEQNTVVERAPISTTERQHSSYFISYSSKDLDFAERLNADLRAKGLRLWFAPEDLKIGDRFQERIEESIRSYEKFMIILSKASVQSPWVEREVNVARELEDEEKRTVLFPIRIDDEVMNTPDAWAADLRRQRHIGDFTRWKEYDFYQSAFTRLLRDLESPHHAETKEQARTQRLREMNR